MNFTCPFPGILSTNLNTGHLEMLAKSFPSMTTTDVIKTASFDKYENIISLAYNLLTDAKFDVYPNKGVIEFHEYAPKKSAPVVYSPLTIHCDDNGAISYPVETCIFYLQRDPSILGGNLDVWDYEPNWLLSCFRTPEPTQEILIESGLVLLMRGDVYHRPQDVRGTGIRRSIVVQLRSKQDR